MIYKKINIPLYHQFLQIVISDDVELEIDTIRQKCYISTEHFEFAGYAEANGKNHIIVLNGRYLEDEIFKISTIAHEALHITNFVMKRVGIKSDVDNDEAQAYLLSWIVEQVYKQFKK